MLKKLLKYDIKYVLKSQLIFYIITFILISLTNLSALAKDNTIIDYICNILSIISIIFMVLIIVNNVMKLWARFINNIYKDESYLTHTLPVTKKQIYLSKFLTAIITLSISLIVIFLLLLLMFQQAGGISAYKSMIKGLSNFNNSFISGLISIFIIYAIQTVNLIQIGYTGIILGHKENNNKIIKSLIYGFICYILVSGLLLLLVYIIGLFNPSILKLFTSNIVPEREVIRLLLTGIMIMYIIVILIFYVFNNKLLNKGVNID